MKFDININDYVYVQLTDAGKQIYYDHYAYIDKLSSVKWVAPKLKEDKEGYAAFQIWEFMNLFGPKIYMGMGENLFVSNSLQFRGDTSVRDY